MGQAKIELTNQVEALVYVTIFNINLENISTSRIRRGRMFTFNYLAKIKYLKVTYISILKWYFQIKTFLPDLNLLQVVYKCHCT